MTRVLSYRGDLEAARKAYISLCQDYLSDEARQPAFGGATWYSIRTRALARAIECHDRLGRKADKLSVMLGLEYLSLLPILEGLERQDPNVNTAMRADTASRVIEAMSRFNDLRADQGESAARLRYKIPKLTKELQISRFSIIRCSRLRWRQVQPSYWNRRMARVCGFG